MKSSFFFAIFFASIQFFAQTTSRPTNWFNLYHGNDTVFGVGTEKSYNELLKSVKANSVIVAVLDCGVDFYHEDLKDNMWVNPLEIPDNGIDDDKNGYIDDIHGWNFIGGTDGNNVEFDNLEMTRLLRKLKPLYEKADPENFKTKEQKNEYQLFLKITAEYNSSLEINSVNYNNLKDLNSRLSELNQIVKSKLNIDTIYLKDLQNYTPLNASEIKSKMDAMRFLKTGAASNLELLVLAIREAFDFYKSNVEYFLNLNYDPRPIVGDNYADSYEKYYGNPDCKGPDSFHGTHVAGIIAAKRNNGIGIDGITDNAKIMAIRCVPNGDERDKDVANAIRYAVDNGAKIINMSFGKKYAWDRKVVEDAIRYAESNDVLLVHGAGNDHLNVDSNLYFPTENYIRKGK